MYKTIRGAKGPSPPYLFQSWILAHTRVCYNKINRISPSQVDMLGVRYKPVNRALYRGTSLIRNSPPP